MNTCIDNQYLAADGTIVLYTGSQDKIDIPGVLDNMKVRCIGNGSFMELAELIDVHIPYGVETIGQNSFYGSGKLKSAALPGTIEKIGKNAFCGCNALGKMVFYDIELTMREYTVLKERAFPYARGEYISHYIPEFFNKIGLDEALDIEEAAAIPQNAPLLFVSDNLHNKGAKKLYENSEYISSKERNDSVWEDKAFQEHIKSGSSETYSHTAENLADKLARENRTKDPEKTFLFSFDDSRTKKGDYTVKITSSFRIGYFFWQSARRVVCDKKEYFIYQRNYLSSRKDTEYVQVDTAVYCGTNLVTDRKEAQRVYGKYKLLSIL